MFGDRHKPGLAANRTLVTLGIDYIKMRYRYTDTDRLSERDSQREGEGEGSRQTDRPSQKDRQMVKNGTTEISAQRREDRRSLRWTPRQK